MMSQFGRIAFFVLLLSIGLISGGLPHPLYSAASLLLFLWLVMGAIPAGGLLFGKNSDRLLYMVPVAIILHSLILSAVGYLFGVNRIVFIVYLLLLTPLVRKAWRQRRELVGQHWGDKKLWLWLIFTLAAISIPLLQVGVNTDSGMAFRAYFNYDFLKHLSIAGSLTSSGIPPANPYLSGYTLHYYWFFYVLPAFWMRLFPGFSPHFVMILFTIIGSMAFASCVYGFFKGLLTSKVALWLSFLLLIAGGSYEGVYGIYRLRERGLGWEAFTTLNVDGLTRWYWKTPQIDALYRSLLYAPQHLIVLCVFLIWLHLRTRKVGLIGSVLLYAMVFSGLGFGAILGAALIACVAFFLLIDIVRSPREKMGEIAGFSLLGVFFLVLYFSVYKMFLFEGGSLQFGLVAPVWDRLPQYLLLNLGALLPFGMAGFIWRQKEFPTSVLVVAAILSLVCMHFVKDHVGGSEVTLKLGYLLDLCLLISTAGFFQGMLQKGKTVRWLLFPVYGLILAPALITWGMDLYNTQDVTNQRFTTYVPLDEKRAFEWMRRNLPQNAVVQTDTLDAGQANVSTLPSLGQRSMYLGDQFHARAFQVPLEEVEQRRRLVTAMSRQMGSAGLSLLVQRAGIQFLVVGNRSGQVRDLLNEPYFSTEYESGPAIIARVNPIPVDRASIDEVDLLWKDDSGNVLRVDYQNFLDPEAGPDSSLWRWMENDGQIIIDSSRDIHGKIRMDVSSLGVMRHLRVFSGDKLVQEVEIQPAGTELEFPVSFTSGKNTLTLNCPEGAEMADIYARNGDQRLLSLQMRRLKFEP